MSDSSVSELNRAANTVQGIVEKAVSGLVERRTLVELVVLATVAGEHLLVVGPPGTAKSAAVRTVADQLGAKTFEYLISRFTEPSELFGTVDLQKLRGGRVEVRTEDMLPEAEFAFLDEVFLGSTAILNQLLTLLNERVFRSGHTRLQSPLRTCVAASNALPESSALAAFADRFLLRHFVEPVPDSSLEALLSAGWEPKAKATPVGMGPIDALRAQVAQVDLAKARPVLADAVRALRNAGIALSDRRLVRVQRLVAAAALLEGRTEAGIADLWPLHFAIPTHEGQQASREILRNVLAHSESRALRSAAEEAAASPTARAARLAASAEEALAATEDDAPARRRLRLESIAREIDANFSADGRPPEIEAARKALVAALEALPGTPSTVVVEAPPQ